MEIKKLVSNLNDIREKAVSIRTDTKSNRSSDSQKLNHSSDNDCNKSYEEQMNLYTNSEEYANATFGSPTSI